MKVLLLSDTHSEHTEKWALGLASNGVKVGLFSLHKSSYAWYEDNINITLLHEPEIDISKSNNSSKLFYLKFIRTLRSAIKIFQPDILHAHYATSYGLLGALSGFHPYIISAWGTDVMKFPQKNFINKALLQFNFKRADAICATSHTIENYLRFVTHKSVHIIPFGIDINVFKKKVVNRLFDEQTFVIGCVKALEELYNIDILIRAFSVLKIKYPDISLKLLIIGIGSQEVELKQLVTDVKMTDHVVFTGRIPFSEVSHYFNMLDVLVNISDYESFGVSVIEAMACEKPVIVTNTGGLNEIVENENYGMLVDIKNVEQTVKGIETYLLNEELKYKIGRNAREKVIKKYNWKDNINSMINVYTSLLHK